MCNEQWIHMQWYLWKYFYQLIFLEFDVNVFEAILSIQRYFKLTECREDFLNIHCSGSVVDCWNTFLKKKIDRKCKRSLRLEGIIKNICKCWNNYYLLIKNLQWSDCVKIPKNICKVHNLYYKTSTKRQTIGNVKHEIRNNNHSHGQKYTFFECQWI